MNEFELELRSSERKMLVLTDDETDTVVVGFVCYSVSTDEVYILNVGVKRDFRRRGVASRLLRVIFNIDVSRFILEVRKINNSAIQLYQKFGFNIVSLRRNFYSDGGDAYFMERISSGVI